MVQHVLDRYKQTTIAKMLNTAVLAYKQDFRHMQRKHQQRVGAFSALCAATVHATNVCTESHSSASDEEHAALIYTAAPSIKMLHAECVLHEELAV
jgi:hypothetical protein